MSWKINRITDWKRKKRRTEQETSQVNEEKNISYWMLQPLHGKQSKITSKGK